MYRAFATLGTLSPLLGAGAVTTPAFARGMPCAYKKHNPAFKQYHKTPEPCLPLGDDWL
jgi:hypothetical protein